MSAYMHESAHVDVCVDALMETRYVKDPETTQPVQETAPTDLGKRLIRANIESMIARYGDKTLRGVDTSSFEDCELSGYAPQLREYRHRPNRAVAALWRPRRLATLCRALDSMAYQCCEVDGWDTSPVATLLQHGRDDLAWQLCDLLAVDGSWCWPDTERGRVPSSGPAPWSCHGTAWLPPVEIVEGGGGAVRAVVVAGETATPTTWRVDASEGGSWEEWRAARDKALAAASPAARAALLELYADPVGGEEITGRDGTDWLDGITAPDSGAAR